MIKKGIDYYRDRSSPPILPYNKWWDYPVGVFVILKRDAFRRIKLLFCGVNDARGVWGINHWVREFSHHYSLYLNTIRKWRWEYGLYEKPQYRD